VGGVDAGPARGIFFIIPGREGTLSMGRGEAAGYLTEAMVEGDGGMRPERRKCQ